MHDVERDQFTLRELFALTLCYALAAAFQAPIVRRSPIGPEILLTSYLASLMVFAVFVVLLSFRLRWAAKRLGGFVATASARPRPGVLRFFRADLFFAAYGFIGALFVPLSAMVEMSMPNVNVVTHFAVWSYIPLSVIFSATAAEGYWNWRRRTYSLHEHGLLLGLWPVKWHRFRRWEKNSDGIWRLCYRWSVMSIHFAVQPKDEPAIQNLLQSVLGECSVVETLRAATTTESEISILKSQI